MFKGGDIDGKEVLCNSLSPLYEAIFKENFLSFLI